MDDVKWICPNCGNVNTKRINHIDSEMGLIENGMCDDCLAVSQISIALEPVATNVLLRPETIPPKSVEV